MSNVEDVASDPEVRSLLCTFRTTAYWHGRFQRPSCADVDTVEAYIVKLEGGVRRVHQLLKRGEATEDHGALGNLACIIDHLTDLPSAL